MLTPINNLEDSFQLVENRTELTVAQKKMTVIHSLTSVFTTELINVSNMFSPTIDLVQS